MAETYKKLYPLQFFLRFLEQNVRPDGRSLDQTRPLIVKPGPLTCTEGSSLVRLGNTSVVCGIKLEVGVPGATTPRDGIFDVSLELSPLCSPEFEFGKQGEQASSVASSIKRALLTSKALDLSQLCIQEGESVWVLRTDLVVLDYDGNILDACMFAVCSALLHLRLPEASTDKTGKVVVTEHRPHSLHLKHIPLPFSFGFIEDYELADPTADEEAVLHASLTVVVTKEGALCSVEKPGGQPLSQQSIDRCIAIAKERAKQITL